MDQGKTKLDGNPEKSNIPESISDDGDLNETVVHAGSEPAEGGGGPTHIEMPSAIGRYDIRSQLGIGGFGAVYLGYDRKLDRKVAVKVPLLQRVRHSEQAFLQEARKLAQLTHPGIVTVHDVGVENSICYIVSEYLEGTDLKTWMRDNELPWQESAATVAAIAEALAFAHARNTVHRDVKPANIIMTDRGDGFAPVLVDFGLALSEASLRTKADKRGAVVGTPHYMAPEQVRGQGHRIDGRTDVYALGVILYRMLSGRLPFVASDQKELLQSIVSDEPRPLRQFVRGLPRELERICLKAIAKKLSDRYTTAGDLAQDLRNLLRDEQNRKQRASATVTAQDKAGSREPTKILIADDHELSRFKLQSDLEKWGYEVNVAEDGEQAWEYFQKNEYSIVITDWMMPKLSGLELVRMIRGSEQSNYVYVIMLTARAEKHDIVAGMGAGADDFLTKPFHRDELQVRLRAGIRITNLNRQLNATNKRLLSSQTAAAEMQKSFLPTVKPRIKDCNLAWSHVSCGRLGGDLFNVVSLDDEHVGLYMLDVNGEGIPAALLATGLSRVMSPASDPASLLVERSDTDANASIRQPADVLKELNRRFGAQDERQFFSIAYGLLDLNSRELQFSSAGHPPLLYQRSGASPSMLNIDGFPIGIDAEGQEFQQQSISLRPGDRILLYSDGLPDAMNGEGEVFGAARLLESMETLSRELLDHAVESLTQELADWRGEAEFTSDVSILALELQ